MHEHQVGTVAPGRRAHRLRVADDGTVSDAVVDSSSGSREIDTLAIAWVKAHWRYRPALRGGLPVVVTTTAIVPF